jgi:TonB-linked SusC/RagA family outer membrane protein
MRSIPRLVSRIALGVLVAAGLALLAPGAAAQETGTVTGRVADAGGGPLPGANVVLVNTDRGTSTDRDGRFEIAGVDAGTYTVRVSFVGFLPSTKQVSVEAGETATVDVTLRPDVARLDSVVVVGYGQQERRDLTGSVTSVDGSELSKVATSDVAGTLQGQVAGVDVTPSSGAPGSTARIRVRGVGTLNNASPLYVVDGVLTDDISYLNPNDIESVEVLKDASATAIYGSRGANGVIIISTKQGERGQETTFSANVSQGWSQLADPIDLVNARQYATLANEARANAGQPPVFDTPDQFGKGTDWQDYLYDVAPRQEVQLSARGGTERTAYNFSANYVREDGIARKSDFERASFRTNNAYDLTDNIEFGNNLTFTYRRGTEEPPGIVRNAYFAAPTATPRTDGEFSAVTLSSGGNPAANAFYHRNSYSGVRLVGNVFGEVSFLEHFTFESSLGVDYDRREERNFEPTFFVSSVQQNEQSAVQLGTVEESSWNWENTLSYNQAFENHSVDAVVGVTAQELTHEELGGSRLNVVGQDPSLWYLSAGQQDGQQNYNTAFDWAILSYLGRVNYDYLGRYLFTATMRVDGSSRFGENKRYGVFPSGAVGWRLSDEPFLRGVEALSNLKLRASYGIVGNDKIGAYPADATVGTNLNAVLGEGESLQFGATPNALANPDVRWEETRQFDVGLDVGFFDDRLTGEFDYYRRVTDGILLRLPLPDLAGVDVLPFVNAAEVRNSGFEARVGWSQSLENGFSYSVSVNGSTVDNEVEALAAGRTELFGGQAFGTTTTRTAPGLPVGAFFGYKVNGVYQTAEEIQNTPSTSGAQPGDLNFADVSGDGVVNANDRTQIGSPIPDYTFGATLSAEYAGFDLSATLSSKIGHQVYNLKKALRFGVENFEASTLDRWTGPGTSNSEPRVTNSGRNYRPSEYLVSDADHLKIRNVQLGYTLPGSISGTANLEQARIYANATNLYTFDGYSGYTPEIGGGVLDSGIDTGVYPTSRTLTIGLDLRF